MKSCGHTEIRSGCQICFLYENDEAYRKLYDGDLSGTVSIGQVIEPAPLSAEQKAPEKLKPCVHLGEPTGELRECPACEGKIQLKLFHCAVFGECTPQRKIEGVACCAAGCPRYEPKNQSLT